jgi:SAM-dependent methyltransferase
MNAGPATRTSQEEHVLDSSGPSPSCRFCGSVLQHTFVDLGMSPLCETFLERSQLNEMEPFYPLHVYVCDRCFLVQLEEYVAPEGIFGHDYPYYSSYSDSWLRHAETYAQKMVDELRLGPDNRVVELGSNDGYLLQFFVQRGVPVLGVEPAANVAEDAERRGVPTRVLFFGEDAARSLREEGVVADLIVGNNVLAQVPDLNGFVEGMRILLADTGTITIEFPHLMRLVEGNQFDTIYHEHFSYFSFVAAQRIFAGHGLRIFDVEELSSHGGSLRIYAAHEAQDRPLSDRAAELHRREESAGLLEIDYYSSFAPRVEETKRKLLRFLIDAKDRGKTVAGYGAPGKGNTLLNYCGIREDLLEFTVDRNPHKHGRFLPGTHIPIHAPERIAETRPDYVLILPWNLKDEIIRQMGEVRSWGGRFLVPIPEVKVFE